MATPAMASTAMNMGLLNSVPSWSNVLAGAVRTQKLSKPARARVCVWRGEGGTSGASEQRHCAMRRRAVHRAALPPSHLAER